MLVAVLYGKVFNENEKDQQDVLTEVEFVTEALKNLGYEILKIPVSMDLKKMLDLFQEYPPFFAFNLVDSLDGAGRLIHMVPSVMDYLSIPYTGCPAESIYQTSNKLITKRLLKAYGLNTPSWLTATDILKDKNIFDPPYIIKSIWEHASIGLNESSIIYDRDELKKEIRRNSEKYGKHFFVEEYIEGREFNISLLSEGGNVEILPAAEITFSNYPEDKPKIVDYRAKWIEDSFEYFNTLRSFDFSLKDKSLLEKLSKISGDCWELFEMEGYGRVDFRVSKDGIPFVLEINTNPCLSPDGGFVAAANKSGLNFKRIIERIIEVTLMKVTKKDKSKSKKDSSKKKEKKSLSLEGIIYREESRKDDLAKIRRIVESTDFFNKEEVDVAVELVEERLEKGTKSGYEFIFADLNDKMIGYGCFGKIHGTISSYDLYWIAVEKDFQRYGLGKAILKKCEEKIKEMGGERVYIETSGTEKYTPTRGFYENYGYKLEARLKDFYNDGDDKVIYVSNVSSNKKL